jgi:lipoate-protein ligase A
VQQAVLSGLTAQLGIAPCEAAILDEEEASAEALHDDEIGTDAFVYEIDQPGGTDVITASLTGPGGTVSVYLRLSGAAPRISDILISGDFFVTPPRMVYDLEAELRGLPAAEAGPAVERFFARSHAELLSVAPETFKSVIEAALEARAVQ